MDKRNYKVLLKIAQGAFGEVFKAETKCGQTEEVALKVLMAHSSDVEQAKFARREMRILEDLQHHQHIVRLIETIWTERKGDLKPCLVFELCQYNLRNLLTNYNLKFTFGEIKAILQQMLRGIAYVHIRRVLHRDIKPTNILINDAGIVKIADFGLAREMEPIESSRSDCYSTKVGTLRYRAPELLLGFRDYGPPADLWSLGCVAVQLWSRKTIMRGETEKEQLQQISRLCGGICPDLWPKRLKRSAAYLEVAPLIEKDSYRRPLLDEILARLKVDPWAADLLRQLLSTQPWKRGDADHALDHAIFYRSPFPEELVSMLARHEHSRQLCPPYTMF